MDNKKPYKIVFVGGGTGGHISPNIAIIDEIKKVCKKKDIFVDFLYIGRMSGIEKEIVEKKGIIFKGIFTGKLRRYWHWRNFTDLFLILMGFIQSFFILLFNRPKIIFAKGGFVTVPFCLAAVLLRIPFVIHESDSFLGLSNKILLPFAKKLYLGFPPEAYESSLKLSIRHANKILFTGNPVREEIFESHIDKKLFCTKYGLNPRKKIIFVFGGSQGAEGINKLIGELIGKIVPKYILLHATGRENENYFKEGFFDLSEKDRNDYLVFGYVREEMADFLNNADLVISRAGANAIAEIIVLKKPSIIIPFPYASSDHQKKNASFLQKNTVASVLDEKFLTPEGLLEEIDFLIKDRKVREKMIKNMKNIFPSNSSKLIAEDILKIASN